MKIRGKTALRQAIAESPRGLDISFYASGTWLMHYKSIDFQGAIISLPVIFLYSLTSKQLTETIKIIETDGLDDLGMIEKIKELL